jgi:hypothetical protein
MIGQIILVAIPALQGTLLVALGMAEAMAELRRARSA